MTGQHKNSEDTEQIKPETRRFEEKKSCWIL